MRAMTSNATSAPARNRKILLSGGVGVAQRLAQLSIGLITLPLVLHTLGSAGFGVWGAATSLAWAVGMLDLGLGSALITLIPQARAQAGEVLAYISASLAGGAALAAVLLLGCGALALLLPGLRPGPPFIIAAACLALNIPLSIAGNIWFGLQKGHVAGLWDLLQTVLMLTGLLFSAWMGGGINAMVASVYGALLIGNAGSLMHLLLRHPALRPKLGLLSLAVLARVSRTGLMLSALSVVISCAYVFDNIFTLEWLSPDAAARMTVATRLCFTAIGFLAVATQALWPAFVEAVAARDHAWVRRALWRGTLGVGLLALTGSAAILAFGPACLHWWLRQNLGISPLLFWSMAAWIVVLSLPRVAMLLLNAVGALRAQIIIQALATAAALALKFFLARRLGASGILLATPLVWLLFVCPAYAWLATGWVRNRMKVER